MNELIIRENMLPDTIEDISKFVLIGTEKLVALKAEIKAIQKVKLAQEVYQQKLEEQRILSDLIVDACRKVGEFTNKLPLASGGDRKSEEIKNRNTAKFDNEEEIKSNDTVTFDNEIKPKTEAIKELGFSKNQVSRFELMADNPKLVEQAKQEAKEKDECITQTKVINFIKEKQQSQEQQIKEVCKTIDEDYEIEKEYRKAMYAIITVRVDRERLEAWARTIKHEKEKKDILDNISDSIETLQGMRNFLANKKINSKEK